MELGGLGYLTYVISQKSHHLGIVITACCIFVLPTHIKIQVLVSTNVCSLHMVINTMINWNRADYDYFEYCLITVCRLAVFIMSSPVCY